MACVLNLFPKIVSLHPTELLTLLGIIFVSVVFGVATGITKEKGKPFSDFFTSMSAVLMTVIQWFMW